MAHFDSDEDPPDTITALSAAQDHHSFCSACPADATTNHTLEESGCIAHTNSWALTYPPRVTGAHGTLSFSAPTRLRSDQQRSVYWYCNLIWPLDNAWMQNLAMLMFSFHWAWMGYVISPMSIHRIMIADRDMDIQRMFAALSVFRASIRLFLLPPQCPQPNTCVAGDV